VQLMSANDMKLLGEDHVWCWDYSSFLKQHQYLTVVYKLKQQGSPAGRYVRTDPQVLHPTRTSHARWK
jgi:hypothetical protein